MERAQGLKNFLSGSALGQSFHLGLAHFGDFVCIFVNAHPQERSGRRPRCSNLIPHGDIGNIYTVFLRSLSSLKAHPDLEFEFLDLRKEPLSLIGQPIMSGHYLASPADVIGIITMRRRERYCVP